ncbi:MAG: hypothetical protein BWY79_00751 [Actinobacteria bacterium ADurb.Bin444]|nr:MAG: hypothetical protein BWY79_00751 [Actinobacteria bacterium ADurb.Bin444]
MRSGRALRTTASTAVPIKASPTPIIMCTETMAGSVSCSGAVPDIHNCRAHDAEASTTASHDAMATAARKPVELRPRRRRSQAKTAYPNHPPMMAMLKTLAPRAVMPPSAMSRACSMSTAVMTRNPAHGPSNTQAINAPRKCPLVPAATGKFSI